MPRKRKPITVDEIAEHVGRELMLATAHPSEPQAKQDFGTLVASVSLGRKPTPRLTAEHIRQPRASTETVPVGILRQVGLPDGMSYGEAIERLPANRRS